MITTQLFQQVSVLVAGSTHTHSELRWNILRHTVVAAKVQVYDGNQKRLMSSVFFASSAEIARGLHWPALACGGDQAAGSTKSNF